MPARDGLCTHAGTLHTCTGNAACYLQGNPAFLEKVTIWQRKLGAVDMVLSAWTDVQRKWQGLQSIFVGSADIRVQLPEDSARFDTLNIDFQVPLTRLLDCFDSRRQW